MSYENEQVIILNNGSHLHSFECQKNLNKQAHKENSV